MSTSDPPRSPAAPDAPILAFGRELGPASEAYLGQAEALEDVRARLRAGADLEDAVLAVIHGAIGGHRRVADEFAAYFLLDLMRMGKLSMSSSSRLRRFLDTGDLVVSVFGDLWGDLAGLRFETRQQFKTLFAQRMHWKATDQARRLNSKRRREDRRLPQQPEDLGLADSEATPLPLSIRKEEREHLILILLRLKDRDRQLLTLHLKGESLDSIAQTLDLSYDAARKALTRAVEQARKLARSGDRDPSVPLPSA